MRSDEPVNILLVDDQPAKLLSYEVILDELGENMLKASSGREALALLRLDRAEEATAAGRTLSAAGVGVALAESINE